MKKKKVFPFLKYSNVFHLSQCEDIKSKIQIDKQIKNNIPPDEEAEQTINKYINFSGVQINTVNGSNEAFYKPSIDTITLPSINQFLNKNSYYSTAFHEIAHSTGHKKRLDRISKDIHFGSKDYSKEELIAEISTCMLMNFLGLEIPDTFENSVAYIKSWSQKLKDDNKIILTAANHQAQKAVNFILNKEELPI